MGTAKEGPSRAQKVSFAARYLFWAAILLVVGPVYLGIGAARMAAPTIRKYWPLAAQYFVQGCQFAFLAVVVVRLYLGKEAEVGQTANFMSAVTAAWALKAMWAIIADRWREHRQLVLALANIAMGVVLVAMSLTWGRHSFMLVAVLVLGLLRCLQDVTTDGLSFDLLRAKERSTGQSFMWIAATLGAWMGGAQMLTLKSVDKVVCGIRIHFGYESLCLLVAAIVVAVGLAGLWGSGGVKTTGEATRRSVGWRDLLAALRQTPMVALGVALLSYVGGSTACSAFIGQWFASLGMDAGAQAVVETVSTAATVVGVLLAGLAGRRLSSRAQLVAGALLVAASYAAIGLAAPLWHHQWLMVVLIGIATIGDGAWPVFLCTGLMGPAEGRAAATRYAIFAGAINLSLLLGPQVGKVVFHLAEAWVGGQFKYPTAFVAVGIIQLSCLLPFVARPIYSLGRSAIRATYSWLRSQLRRK